MRQVVLENVSKAWDFGYAKYVKAAVRNVKEYLSKKGEALKDRAPTPLSNTYRPEIEIS